MRVVVSGSVGTWHIKYILIRKTDKAYDYDYTWYMAYLSSSRVLPTYTTIKLKIINSLNSNSTFVIIEYCKLITQLNH